MKEVDKKIKKLVEFMNKLPNCMTVASCEGHDKQIKDEVFNPYILFRCNNPSTLRILTEINYNKEVLFGHWEIKVLPDKFHEDDVVYSLEASNYDKPSDVHGDWNILLELYQNLL